MTVHDKEECCVFCEFNLVDPGMVCVIVKKALKIALRVIKLGIHSNGINKGKVYYECLGLRIKFMGGRVAA